MASKKLHKTEYTSILNNKLNFALYCERNALSTPAIIGHNFGRSFFSGKGIQEISSIGELIYFYAEIFGPTIIEGNEDPHLFMSDVAYGGLLKNLLMKKVMARLK